MATNSTSCVFGECFDTFVVTSGGCEDAAFRNSVNEGYILQSAYLIFLMQAGFAMVEAACVAGKNANSILVKNTIDFLITIVSYTYIGYSFAFRSLSVFSDPDDLAFYFFHLVFAGLATTILSGPVAERISLRSFGLLCFVTAGCTYPLISGWIWRHDGWLNEEGFVDFAGGTAVHVVGGTAALVTTIFLGPRVGRFADYTPWNGSHIYEVLQRRSPDPECYVLPLGMPPLQLVTQPFWLLIGTFLLWFGWFGIIPGSTHGLSHELGYVASRVAAVTVLGACGGGLSAAVLSTFRPFKVADLSLGILAGLVSVTSDVVSAWPIHGAAGIWGAVAVGLFARSNRCGDYVKVGLLVADGSTELEEALELLGEQVYGVIAVISTTAAITAGTIILMNQCPFTRLRVSRQEELEGLDWAEHAIQNVQQARQEVLESLVHSLGQLYCEWDLSWLSPEAGRLRLHKSTSGTMESALSAFAHASRALKDSAQARKGKRMSGNLMEDGEMPVFLPLGTLRIKLEKAELKSQLKLHPGAKQDEDHSHMTIFVEVRLCRGDEEDNEAHPNFRRPRVTHAVEYGNPVWNESVEFANVGNEIANDLLIRITVIASEPTRQLSPWNRGRTSLKNYVIGDVYFRACPTYWGAEGDRVNLSRTLASGMVSSESLVKPILLSTAQRSLSALQSLQRRISFGSVLGKLGAGKKKKIIPTGKLFFRVSFCPSHHKEILKKTTTNLDEEDSRDSRTMTQELRDKHKLQRGRSKSERMVDRLKAKVQELREKGNLLSRIRSFGSKGLLDITNDSKKGSGQLDREELEAPVKKQPGSVMSPPKSALRISSKGPSAKVGSPISNLNTPNARSAPPLGDLDSIVIDKKDKAGLVEDPSVLTHPMMTSGGDGETPLPGAVRESGGVKFSGKVVEEGDADEGFNDTGRRVKRKQKLLQRKKTGPITLGKDVEDETDEDHMDIGEESPISPKAHGHVNFSGHDTDVDDNDDDTFDERHRKTARHTKLLARKATGQLKLTPAQQKALIDAGDSEAPSEFGNPDEDEEDDLPEVPQAVGRIKFDSRVKDEETDDEAHFHSRKRAAERKAKLGARRPTGQIKMTSSQQKLLTADSEPSTPGQDEPQEWWDGDADDEESAPARSQKAKGKGGAASLRLPATAARFAMEEEEGDKKGVAFTGHDTDVEDDDDDTFNERHRKTARHTKLLARKATGQLKLTPAQQKALIDAGDSEAPSEFGGPDDDEEDDLPEVPQAVGRIKFDSRVKDEETDDEVHFHSRKRAAERKAKLFARRPTGQIKMSASQQKLLTADSEPNTPGQQSQEFGEEDDSPNNRGVGFTGHDTDIEDEDEDEEFGRSDRKSKRSKKLRERKATGMIKMSDTQKGKLHMRYDDEEEDDEDDEEDDDDMDED
ncbi:unnamed protein product [Vitrella brassicaformis CCMP3155]|uniref:Ammonium transporter AmtB-like domain-containing protein n=1 Tax=Vitrella brassicaformis (strain CCMP3155) TaxID=1169540 RepID=A0A0G4EUE1_VITBC|nr:unnamed protein product [Vitrella brassicaformis CCMP3155]|eukprot:CEM02269.1 unnamed protein product [Vitrella brassicaformis CCMP3155]